MADAIGFDRFYTETRPRLLRQLTVMVGNRELARDALHDAYERAWQSWSKVARHPDAAARVGTVAWRLKGTVREAARVSSAMPMTVPEETSS
jgi:predicted RNA polymerase sigma factor